MIDFRTHFAEVSTSAVGDEYRAGGKKMDMKRLRCHSAMYVWESVVGSTHVDEGEIDDVLRQLKEDHFMKETSESNAGMPQTFLGRTSTRMEKGFDIRCTEDLTLSMGEVFGLGGASEVSAPGVNADARRDDEVLVPEEASKFRTVCGELLFVSHDRVDLQHRAKARACQRQPPATR